MRGAAVVSGDQHVYLDGQRQRRNLSTPLSRDLIDRMRRVDAGHPGTDSAVRILQEHRLCVLRGTRGTGRGFLGRIVAAKVAETAGRCRLLEPGTDPRELLEEDFEPGHSYVLESPALRADRALAEFTLTNVASLLTQRGAYLVIVVDDATPVGDASERWSVSVTSGPPLTEVLRAHISVDLPRHFSDVVDDLLNEAPIINWLRNDAPTLGEVGRIGRALAGVAHGTTTIDACLEHAVARERERVRDLLGDSGSSREKELAFAVAFFGGFSYATISRVEGVLADVVHARSGKEGARPRHFLRSRAERLAAIDAKFETGVASNEYGSSPAEIVEFTRNQTHDVLIDVAWKDFDASEVLMVWLRTLVVSTDPAVRARAALSIGRLSLFEFADVAENVLQPWGRSNDPRERGAAATALCVAVEDEQVAGHALGLIESWVTGTRRQRMTAALALGLAVRNNWPVAAMDGLGSLLDTEDPAIIGVVRTGIVGVFVVHHELVLQSIDGWLSAATGPRRNELLKVFLLLCNDATLSTLEGSNEAPAVLTVFAGGSANRRTGSESPGPDAAVLSLWRAALNDTGLRDDALACLGIWIKKADLDASMRDMVVDLIVHMAPTNREIDRLKYALEKKTHGTPRPSATARAALMALSSRQGPRPHPEVSR
ncbi:hypothetical protein GCM10009751_10980 [Myceligenerans crystallogenes]|uniref:HEAT repeat-containing protein n=1 Tax=Myceligenerans crystallogenes TaxID=316335 RepID=A0ABN2NBC1_9MICO